MLARTMGEHRQPAAESHDATRRVPLVDVARAAVPAEPATALQQVLNRSVSPAQVLALQRTIGNRAVSVLVQRQAKPRVREDVAVIVGRPSHTIARKESAKEKAQMAAWRDTAMNLAPPGRVFEGLTVDTAFAGVGRLRTPIGRLFIIGHGGPTGIGEIDAKTGDTRSTTMEDLTKRMKAAIGNLKDLGPRSVEILYCSAGGSPKGAAQIGTAIGAPTVHAPLQMTVIGSIAFTVNGKRMTPALLRKQTDKQLGEFIRHVDGLKYYDFVPGVPHPRKPPSGDEKMRALIGVARRTGTIPYVSYNEAPGGRNAVPIWRASVTKRPAGEEELPASMTIGKTGVIEVEVAPAKTAPKAKAPVGR